MCHERNSWQAISRYQFECDLGFLMDTNGGKQADRRTVSRVSSDAVGGGRADTHDAFVLLI